MNLKDPRPYVFYAHIQWLEESGADPHLVLQNGPKTRFPPHLATNSVVTFRVTSEATRNLLITEDGISFSVRFGGKEFVVFAPLDCMLMLASANGEVRIPFQNIGQDQAESQRSKPVPQEEMAPPTREIQPERKKPELSIITGGQSDGVRRGKLSLVPKSPAPTPPQPDPEEPQCA